MKLLLCRIRTSHGEKPVNIAVSVREAGTAGGRTHFCPEAGGQMLSLEVRGSRTVRDIYCPLCGAVVPPELPRHRYDRAVRADAYEGARCVHGFPDLPCTELAALDEAVAFELSMGSAIPEFAAAVLAERYGCAPEVVDWVRPCPICRRESALASMPLLRHGLTRIAEALYEGARVARAQEQTLRDDAARLHQAVRAFEEFVSAVAGDSQRTGFVYLIGHDEAVKIGWSERHPRLARLGALQTASPKPLGIFGLIVGTVADEYDLQSRFVKYRLRGEWFTRADEIFAYFAEHGVDV